MMSIYNGGDSPTRLLQETQKIHQDIMNLYNEQIRTLQIKVALLEDENQKLKERIKNYEG
jgi:hypothetical protein